MGEEHNMQLARFGHHPDPAIDYCIEVEVIEGLRYDVIVAKFEASRADLVHRVARAMDFRVGGDLHCINAKQIVRKIEAELQPASSESAYARGYRAGQVAEAPEHRFRDAIDAWQEADRWVKELPIKPDHTERYGLRFDDPTAQPDGGVLVLMAGSYVLGIVTVVRDDMNFSVLARVAFPVSDACREYAGQRDAAIATAIRALPVEDPE